MSRLALDVPFREYVRHRNASAPPPYDWTDVATMHLRMYAMAATYRGSAS